MLNFRRVTQTAQNTNQSQSSSTVIYRCIDFVGLTKTNDSYDNPIKYTVRNGRKKKKFFYPRHVSKFFFTWSIYVSSTVHDQIYNYYVFTYTKKKISWLFNIIYNSNVMHNLNTHESHLLDRHPKGYLWRTSFPKDLVQNFPFIVNDSDSF